MDGRVHNRAGGSLRHYRVETAVSAFLRRQENSNCESFTGNTAVRLPPDNDLFPDASFACDPLVVTDGIDFLTNPIVIFDILSPSTETMDRGRKAELYRSMPSLQTYVLVTTDGVLVEIHERDGERWTSRLLVGRGAEATFDPFTEPFTTDELYARVTFDGESQEGGNASGA